MGRGDKPGDDNLAMRYCAASLVSVASARSASGCGMAMTL
jgi:hypothetical protein